MAVYQTDATILQCDVKIITEVCRRYSAAQRPFAVGHLASQGHCHSVQLSHCPCKVPASQPASQPPYFTCVHGSHLTSRVFMAVSCMLLLAGAFCPLLCHSPLPPLSSGQVSTPSHSDPLFWCILVRLAHMSMVSTSLSLLVLPQPVLSDCPRNTIASCCVLNLLKEAGFLCCCGPLLGCRLANCPTFHTFVPQIHNFICPSFFMLSQ